MNPFQILCFLLDVLLEADEKAPMSPVQDVDLISVCSLPPVNIHPQDSVKCLCRMRDEGVIRVHPGGGMLLTQKGRQAAFSARFLNIIEVNLN